MNKRAWPREARACYRVMIALMSQIARAADEHRHADAVAMCNIVGKLRALHLGIRALEEL